jgi:hypothetical protein
MDLCPLAADDRPALPPVSLTLSPGRRLEPHRCLDVSFFPQRVDEPLYDIVASPVTPDLELFLDRLSAVGDRCQPLEDIVLMRRQ